MTGDRGAAEEDLDRSIGVDPIFRVDPDPRGLSPGQEPRAEITDRSDTKRQILGENRNRGGPLINSRVPSFLAQRIMRGPFTPCRLVGPSVGRVADVFISVIRDV